MDAKTMCLGHGATRVFLGLFYLFNSFHGYLVLFLRVRDLSGMKWQCFFKRNFTPFIRLMNGHCQFQY